MRIIEHFLCGKENNPETCEDGLVIGESLIAIIDGVTSKGERLWNGKKSGCYAKDILKQYLKQDVVRQDAVTLLRNLDRILKEAVQCVEKKLPSEEYPRAAVLIYNDIYKEIWSYGDCQCKINGILYANSKKIDTMNSELRAYFLEYALMHGATLEGIAENDVGRKGIQNNLLMQFAFENVPGEFGYPILNGMGIEESMIIKYPVKTGDRVVLASDGYPVLGDTLDESERELNRVLKEDPLCFRLYQSTKGVKKGNISFDDRAFCRLEI